MKKNIAIVALAIVAALGLTTTGAVAGIGIGKGNIGGWHIKDGSIKGKDLKPGIRQKAKNGNKALKRVQKNRAAWSRDGLTDHGIINKEVRFTDETGTVELECGDGLVATGGGHEFSAYRSNPVPGLIASEPILVEDGDGTFSASGWTVTADVTGAANVKVWTVCAAE